MVDRSLAGEREEGCWKSLLLYPVSPTMVFFAKVAVTAIALLVLECVLVPAFIVFSNVPLLRHPLGFATVALLANLGYGSVGVVTSALTAQLSNRNNLLPLVLLPLRLWVDCTNLGETIRRELGPVESRLRLFQLLAGAILSFLHP
jgi:ABC-type transport system involved in cytochrome c biogenesis permease component